MGHSNHHQRESNIALVFFINLAFTLIEILGGVWTNSIAVVSDAIHDSGDAMALGLSWYLERVAQRKKDKVFSFGYKRFSLLAALINGIVLLIGTVFILYEAIPRLLHPEPVNVHGMIFLALLGIIVNGIAALRLKKGRSMNESVLSLHLLEDVLGWVAVLIVALGMKLGDFPILDPLLSLIFAAIIIWNSIARIKKTFMIFLQSIPDDVNIDLLEAAMAQFSHVIGIHDTHVWSLDGEHHVLSTHIVVQNQTSIDQIEDLKSSIRLRLNEFDIQHATIEVDFQGKSCPWSTS